MNMSPNRQLTASKLPSSKGSFSAIPSRPAIDGARRRVAALPRPVGEESGHEEGFPDLGSGAGDLAGLARFQRWSPCCGKEEPGLGGPTGKLQKVSFGQVAWRW